MALPPQDPQGEACQLQFTPENTDLQRPSLEVPGGRAARECGSRLRGEVRRLSPAGPGRARLGPAPPGAPLGPGGRRARPSLGSTSRASRTVRSPLCAAGPPSDVALGRKRSSRRRPRTRVFSAHPQVCLPLPGQDGKLGFQSPLRSGPRRVYPVDRVTRAAGSRGRCAAGSVPDAGSADPSRSPVTDACVFVCLFQQCCSSLQKETQARAGR